MRRFVSRVLTILCSHFQRKWTILFSLGVHAGVLALSTSYLNELAGKGLGNPGNLSQEQTKLPESISVVVFKDHEERVAERMMNEPEVKNIPPLAVESLDIPEDLDMHSQPSQQPSQPFYESQTLDVPPSTELALALDDNQVISSPESATALRLGDASESEKLSPSSQDSSDISSPDSSVEELVDEMRTDITPSLEDRLNDPNEYSYNEKSLSAQDANIGFLESMNEESDTQIVFNELPLPALKIPFQLSNCLRVRPSDGFIGVVVDAKGSIENYRLIVSTGYDVLDEQALLMFQQSIGNHVFPVSDLGSSILHQIPVEILYEPALCVPP